MLKQAMSAHLKPFPTVDPTPRGSSIHAKREVSCKIKEKNDLCRNEGKPSLEQEKKHACENVTNKTIGAPSLSPSEMMSRLDRLRHYSRAARTELVIEIVVVYFSPE